MRYVLRRAVHGLMLLLEASALSFLFLAHTPGDYVDEMRLNPQLSGETLAALRVKYGLDQPLATRYIRWLNCIRKGNLGFSFAYNLPVASLLLPRALNTLLLTGTATLLAWIVAIPFGLWSASSGGGWVDRLCLGTTSALLAIPEILLALGLLFIAARTGWFPTGGMVSLGFDELSGWGKAADVAAHFFLPVVVLVLGSLPTLVRHVRASALEVISAPFIGAARAHGIKRHTILFRYVLRAAANPLISLFGLSLAALLSGSLLVEVILGWPGVGSLLVEAVLARDVYVVVGAVMFTALVACLSNWVADGLLYALDPRIRLEEIR
jgi:peptide/nickel transport system permease protein